MDGEGLKRVPSAGLELKWCSIIHSSSGMKWVGDPTFQDKARVNRHLECEKNWSYNDLYNARTTTSCANAAKKVSAQN